jgi:hypothetical protein
MSSPLRAWMCWQSVDERVSVLVDRLTGFHREGATARDRAGCALNRLFLFAG